MQILLEERESVYRPQSQLDSTCLRVPNIVYVLFAGRFRWVVVMSTEGVVLTGKPGYD